MSESGEDPIDSIDSIDPIDPIDSIDPQNTLNAVEYGFEGDTSTEKLFVNPYTPTFLMASVLSPSAHFVRVYLQNLSSIAVFESRMKMKMQIPFTTFCFKWFSVRVLHILSTFSFSFFGKLGVDAVLNFVRRATLTEPHDFDVSAQNEDEEEDLSGDYLMLHIVNTICDHITLAYILRHSFFPEETRNFIWNGFLTHCVIESVYLGSSKLFRRLFSNFAKKEISDDKADSDRMWAVIKELTEADTYSNYGREYIMRHFRDSNLSESQSFALFRMALAYFSQYYYLKKYCHIFGRFKSLFKIIIVDLLISVTTYPLSMIKYSQIKAAGEETFWESSAIVHAKKIKTEGGWLGFYSGFSVHVLDLLLHSILPVIAWGLTDWTVFSWYKYFHPKSGLPTGNPLWQASSECSSSGNTTIIDTMKDINAEDIPHLVEVQSGIASQPKGEFDQCCVCMSRQKACILFPCRHLATCKICTMQLERCPICRQGIESTTRVFW